MRVFMELFNATWTIVPIFISCISLAWYTLVLGHQLTVSIAFPAIIALGQLAFELNNVRSLHSCLRLLMMIRYSLRPRLNCPIGHLLSPHSAALTSFLTRRRFLPGLQALRKTRTLHILINLSTPASVLLMQISAGTSIPQSLKTTRKSRHPRILGTSVRLPGSGGQLRQASPRWIVQQ